MFLSRLSLSSILRVRSASADAEVVSVVQDVTPAVCDAHGEVLLSFSVWDYIMGNDRLLHYKQF